MAEGFQGFVQLRTAHRQVDLGLFQRGIGVERLLRLDPFQGSLYRVVRGGVRLCRPCGPGLAFGLPTLLFAVQTGVVPVETATRACALFATRLLLPGVVSQSADNRYDSGRQWLHLDAVHRAGRDTQVAAGAFVDDDRVHQLGGPDDGVHRTGLDALGAADALGFADKGHLGRRCTALRVQFENRHA